MHALHFKHIYRQSKLVTATGALFHVCDRGLAVTPLAILLLHLRELGTLKSLIAIRFWWHPIPSDLVDRSGDVWRGGIAMT